MSPRVASAVCPMTSSVAGLTLGNVAPLSDATRRPSIRFRVSGLSFGVSAIASALPRSRPHDLTAVHVDHLPGNPCGSVGEQEETGADEIFGRADARQRHLRKDLLENHLGHYGARRVGVGGARRD